MVRALEQIKIVFGVLLTCSQFKYLFLPFKVQYHLEMSASLMLTELKLKKLNLKSTSLAKGKDII